MSSSAYRVGSGGYPREGSQAGPLSPSRMEGGTGGINNSYSNGMVNTPRNTYNNNNVSAAATTTTPSPNSGAYPPKPQSHQHLEGVSFPSAKVGTKFVRAKEAAETAHESQLLKREELHNSLLQAVEARKQRARAISEIHRGEIAAVEEELRRLERDTLELEAKRRELCDAHRVKEVEHFKAGKRAQQSTNNAVAAASPSSSSSSRQHQLQSQHQLYPHHHQSTLQQSYNQALKQSPIRGQGTALMASLLYPGAGGRRGGGGGLEMDGSTPTSLRERYAQEEHEQLLNRLQDADRVASELEKECLANEAKIEASRREREGLSEILAVLREDLTHLEKDAPDVAALLAEAKSSLKLAGSHQNQLPELERIVDDNQMTLQLLKNDFGEVTKMLMDRIKTDDGKIKELRQVDLRSSISTRQDQDEVRQILSSLIRNVTEENLLMEEAMRIVVERSEEQRSQLDGTVEMLKRRISFLEDDLKATMAAATAAKQQRAIASARPPLSGGDYNNINLLNSTHLVGIPGHHLVGGAIPVGGGASPYNLSSYTPTNSHHHHHHGHGAAASPSPMPVVGGGDHYKSPMVAAPATTTTTTTTTTTAASTRSPSSSAMPSATASRFGGGASGPSPYGGGLRGFGDKAGGDVHRRLL